MEWIDATKELPPLWWEKQYLKIRWNEKRYDIRKCTGFYNLEKKVFVISDGGEYKSKYVQWLKE